MSEASVFECSICYSGYDCKVHRPLSLPCGHVFCEQCIGKQSRGDEITCPLDMIKHSVRISGLPSCYAILVNLPKERGREFCCSKHNKKKIKFMCKVHDKFLCTDCIIDHTGSGHLVIAFAVTPSKVKSEAEETSAAWLRRAKELTDARLATDQLEKKLAAHYECQMQRINSAYDSAVKTINARRAELLTSLKQQLSVQLKGLDQHKTRVQSALDIAHKQTDRMRYLMNTFDKASYEDIHSALAAAAADLKKAEEPQFDAAFSTFKDAIRVVDNSVIVREEDEGKEDENWVCKLCSRLNQKENKVCYSCKTKRAGIRFDMSQPQAPPEVMTALDNLGSMTSRHRTTEGSKTEAELQELCELKSPRSHATSRGRQSSGKTQPVNNTPATKRGLGKGRHMSRQRISGRKRNNSF